MHDSSAIDANAAFFSTRDDVFTRIVSRYGVLCDLFSLGNGKFRIVAIVRPSRTGRP